MTGERPIGDDDLHAFVDGQLAPGRRDAVEGYLAQNTQAATRVAADREARIALRESLSFKAQEPIPARLRVAHIAADRRGRLTQRWGAIAAAMAWLAIGAAAGWSAHTMAGPGASPAPARRLVADDALAAHRMFVAEIAHPVEVGAAQEAHLVQWLSKRLGKPLKAPDLASAGFRLMGGRLLPSGQDAAAQFMYEDSGGQRLTLYVRAGGGDETAFRFAQAGEIASFIWVDGDFGYAVSAALDRGRLSAVADAVYRQLATGAGGTGPSL